jgi:hypothetical protein
VQAGQEGQAEMQRAAQDVLAEQVVHEASGWAEAGDIEVTYSYDD